MGSTLFTQEQSPVLVLGVGTLGCAAARLGAENSDEPPGVCWSAAHTNGAELIATGLEKKIFLKIPEGPFAARNVARGVEENFGMITALARGRDAVLLCGCLSDALTPAAMLALSAAFCRLKTHVFVLALEPFSLLGMPNLAELESRAEGLARGVPFFMLLNAGIEKVSAGISARRIERMAAERLMSAAECFAAALDSSRESALQLSALRGHYRGALACAGGSFGNQGGSAACAAFDLALASLDENGRESLSAVCLQSAEELSFRDARAILGRMPDDARSRAVVCAAAKPAFAGQTACLLLSGDRRAANVVGIELGMETADKVTR